jgi:hypothetical protein
MASFTTDELRSMFIWGGIGGALPTLGKIAGTYGANFDAPSPRVLGVLIAIALYGTIGAIIARAIGNPDVKQALFAGIAAPAIVISVLTGASDSQSLHPGAQGSSASLFSPAFAQAPPGSPQGTRSIVIRPQIVGSYPVGGAIQVTAKSRNRVTQVGTVQLNPGSAPTTLHIPSGPTTLLFTSEGAQTQVEVDNQPAILVKVTPMTSVTQDLKWALGTQRALAIGKLEAVAAN